jgi:hypothetical protein
MTRLGTQGDLRSFLEGRLRTALIGIENHDPERLRFDPTEAAEYEIGRVTLEPVLVDWSKCERSEPRETTIQGTEWGETYGVAAQRVDFFVPVAGDAYILGYTASTFSLSGAPELDVRSSEITFSMTSQELDPAAMKAQVATFQTRVDQFAAWVNSDVKNWLPTLRAEVLAAGKRRKARLDDAAAFSSAFDVPVRPAPGARQISVPLARKTLRVTDRPSARASATSAPEPQLADAIYEDVVRMLRAVGNSFERLPRTASKFNEEELRDVLLFILNSNFEGSARGEVFNGSGKTDILIQHHDRNAFIGECKVWRGEKKFGEAIDQLVSYTVWRDTKAALILFIRSGDVTEILAKADRKLCGHVSFESARPTVEADSRTDYLLHAKDDNARLIRVALLPFVLRAGDENADA